LDDLVTVTGLRARFGMWHECGVSYLERSPVPGAPCVSGAEISAAGILPMHATALGKALLAYAPPAEVRRVLAQGLPAYTSHTIVTAGGLLAALTATRTNRVAVCHREWRDGECAIAAPVFGPHGVVAAVELVSDRSSGGRDGTASVVVVAARALGRRLADDPSALPQPDGPAPLRWPLDPAGPLPHTEAGPGFRS
jgi:DNA-binding IclR family transcriptional regulator